MTVDTGVEHHPRQRPVPQLGSNRDRCRAAACSGKTITVQALDAGKNVIATGATTANGSGTANVSWGSSVADANTIAQYAVIIRARRVTPSTLDRRGRAAASCGPATFPLKIPSSIRTPPPRSDPQLGPGP